MTLNWLMVNPDLHSVMRLGQRPGFPLDGCLDDTGVLLAGVSAIGQAPGSVWDPIPRSPTCWRTWPQTCASRVRQGCFQKSPFSCGQCCLAAWGGRVVCGCGNSLISDWIQDVGCINQVREESRLQNGAVLGHMPTVPWTGYKTTWLF